jgi:hypothetical protein
MGSMDYADNPLLCRAFLRDRAALLECLAICGLFSGAGPPAEFGELSAVEAEDVPG